MNFFPSLPKGLEAVGQVPKPQTEMFDNSLIDAYRRALNNGTEPAPPILPPMTRQQDPRNYLPWWHGENSLNKPIPVQPHPYEKFYMPLDKPYTLPTQQQMMNVPQLGQLPQSMYSSPHGFPVNFGKV